MRMWPIPHEELGRTQIFDAGCYTAHILTKGSKQLNEDTIWIVFSEPWKKKPLVSQDKKAEQGSQGLVMILFWIISVVIFELFCNIIPLIT